MFKCNNLIMASFTIEHETKLSQNDSYAKVKKFFQESDMLKKLDGNLETTFDDNKCVGHVKGSKFDCELKVTEDKPSKVVVTVNLSFLLTPFKGKIQETLQQKIQSIFG
jgi:hypothetical protein